MKSPKRLQKVALNLMAAGRGYCLAGITYIHPNT